jgi:hypothetical protein
VPNKVKLSDAFVRVVKPDPERAVAYWDALQRGLVLLVQPSGHRAWKCVYTGARWYHLNDARAIAVDDARKLAAKIMVAVTEGQDPHADRLALRGRGSFEQIAARYVEEHAKKRNKSWPQADALVTKHLLPRWGKLDIGAIRRADIKTAFAAIAAPVLANQVLASASAIFSWAMRQDIVAANPCIGVEKHATRSRERVLSDAELVAFWPHFSAPLRMYQMQADMREICARLGIAERVRPHDLRRTFSSKVTALGFGRDAMNRVTNHKDGGIADVYDRHKYAEENKKIMETVARHIVGIAEGNVIKLRTRR